MAEIRAVADTGPLIALAKTGSFELLEHMFGTLTIPGAVRHELLAKQSSESHQIRRVLSTFLKTVEPTTRPHPVAAATRNLGLGEAEAIALAYQHGALLLMDDARGRKAAARLGIRLVGTVGVIVLAKQAGYVDAVLPILHEIRRNGYWLSHDLLRRAAALADEKLE